LATLAGKPQIVMVNQHTVTGHDPADGRILWSHRWGTGDPKVPQPIPIAPDRVFLTAGYGVGSAMLQITPSTGGAFSASPLWANKSLKSKFANVAIRDGHAYGLDDGILACVDLSTGQRKWRSGRYGHGQVLLVDDLLLVQAESGDVVLLEADPVA